MSTPPPTTEALALSEQNETMTPSPRDAGAAGGVALARAQVEARYLVAIRRPRDEDVVRQRLLKECQRPSFARVGEAGGDPGAALYRLPFSKTPVIGFSVRFAEAAGRCWGNLVIDTRITYDDTARRVVRASVTDLEANLSVEQEGQVDKVVTRRHPLADRRPVRVAQNASGQPNYIYEADERETRQLTNAEISKCLRSVVLRLIPGWLLDECRHSIDETMRAEVKADPDAWRRKLTDAFAAELRVGADQLRVYLGHDIAAATADEIAELRAVYTAVRDGEIGWRAALAAKTGVVGDAADDANAATKAKLAERLAAQRQRGARPTKRAGGNGGKAAPATPPAPSSQPVAPPSPAVARNPQRQPGEEG